MNALIHLLTLQLEENSFSGPISGLNLENLQNFNVSGNNLSGQLPTSLSGFPVFIFSNNLMLSGAPFPDCSKKRRDLTRPDSSFGATVGPTTVSSSRLLLRNWKKGRRLNPSRKNRVLS